MRLAVRLLVVPALVGLAMVGTALSAPSEADAASPRVILVDNDGPTPAQGIDPRSGQWGFAPSHITVMKGEGVTFVNPAGNFRPHDVVSFTRGGTAPNFTWDVGAKFNSGMEPATLLRPAGAMIPNTSDPAPSTWVLDTGTLDPGHYGYLCTLHPWMLGSLTVVAP